MHNMKLHMLDMTLPAMMVQTLSQQFPESDWIVAQAAVAQYNLRNFDDAQELFEELIERDPHRVEVSPCCGNADWSYLSDAIPTGL